MCANCQKKPGCSCQLVTASDGKKVCKTCLVKYEAKILNTHNNGELFALTS